MLVLGSGALQIGQAGEFDYSGSQACRAARRGHLRRAHQPQYRDGADLGTDCRCGVLSAGRAEPVEEILVRERIDAILLGFGGQSALNCGLRLADEGILARHGVRVLGPRSRRFAPAKIAKLFADRLREINVPVARGQVATSLAEANAVAATIGYPLILRAGFSLGGRGSAIVRHADELPAAIQRALAGVGQVLLEECLSGWKEIEYELVRDADDNCITVCNMENFDPMGVHTGESIVVAPSQTLSDADYQLLRDAAIATIRHLGIVGECNIQFALDPQAARYRVIEVNPRLSRSSALASKATGYPLAYVGAKLQLGYSLPSLRNAITQITTACFEPALDYVVCKVPRWDLEKFAGADLRIGTEMKSVGEVMAIGAASAKRCRKRCACWRLGPMASIRGSCRCPVARRCWPRSATFFAPHLCAARAFALGFSVEESQRRPPSIASSCTARGSARAAAGRRPAESVSRRSRLSGCERPSRPAFPMRRLLAPVRPAR